MKIDPYAHGVLKPEAHDRLVADIENISRDASIQPKWIWTPLAETVSAKEVEWVRRFRYHREEGSSGLCLMGTDADGGVEDRMAAIAGALVRNFIRARVSTVGQLVERLSSGEPVPTSTCLLLPNFFIGKAMGAVLADWKTALLFDAILERHLSGLQTVVYVSSMKSLRSEYGAAFEQHIQSNYQILEF